MWLRRVLSRATLDESDISQPIPAGLLNSTEDFSAIPDMISFFYLSCKLFRLSKAIWSVVNARSKQATRRHHLDRQTRSGSRQYTPTQKKPCIFGAIFNQISLTDIASCDCMILFWLPCLFPPNCGFDADKGGDYQDSILPKGGNHLNSAGNLLTSQFVADTAKNRYFFSWLASEDRTVFFWQLVLSAKSIGGLNEFWCIWLGVCL